uniref:Uncharacterized protein n=1 Tax=Nelumbo nucifera TaxID=4432 RepID=A0A822Z9N3_NELNU|nr:TPA_asm: hypothetical protein HUJ06_014412 [Nelumbo nucifera]
MAAESQSFHEIQMSSTSEDPDAVKHVVGGKNNDNSSGEGDQNRGETRDDINSRVLEEIFGKDPEVVVRPRKRRFQSIAYIYLMTKPLDIVHSKKMRC